MGNIEHQPFVASETAKAGWKSRETSDRVVGLPQR